jgi:hypothetical protein
MAGKRLVKAIAVDQLQYDWLVERREGGFELIAKVVAGAAGGAARSIDDHR